MSGKSIQITIDGKVFEAPFIKGTEGEKGFDIAKLRSETGYITLDEGYGNTGACTSNITFIDGEKGILRHYGIPIEQLAEKSTFQETAYLCIYGKLPTQKELEAFRLAIRKEAEIPAGLISVIKAYPLSAHPMVIVANAVSLLSAYYPELCKPVLSEEELNQVIVILLGKVRTIVAYAYRHLSKKEIVHPAADLDFVPNFLNMMFGSSEQVTKQDEDIVRVIQMLLILHADHEQNCSTSTVRLVGSSHANVFATIGAGFAALWGPRHGGANQAVLEMLEHVRDEGGNVEGYIKKAKDKNSDIRLMGFGHRVYKNYDPRARVIKKLAEKIINKVKGDDPLLEIAHQLEAAALKDPYFTERKLFPNVDFYSGIIYRSVGIPETFFTVMFALGRLPGWIAQWKELIQTPGNRIGRPRQIYTGPKLTDYTPLNKRS